MRSKATLFQRIIWAISDFRVHPFTQREKTSKAFSYFAKLIALLSFVLTIYFYSQSLNIANEFIHIYQNEIPNFTLQNGNLNADDVAKFKYEESLVIVDTNYSAEDLLKNSSEDTKNYDSFTLVSNDELNIYARGENSNLLVSSLAFKNIKNDTSKQEIAEGINSALTSTMFKICLFALIFMVTYISYLLAKLLSSIMTMLIAYIFTAIFGLKMKFRNYFVMAMYVLTLPVIIETIAIIVVGRVSESTEFIYQILVCVYTFYALRALKLDQILLSNELRDLKEELSNGNFSEIKFDENKSEDDKASEDNKEEKNDDENK